MRIFSSYPESLPLVYDVLCICVFQFLMNAWLVTMTVISMLCVTAHLETSLAAALVDLKVMGEIVPVRKQYQTQQKGVLQKQLTQQKVHFIQNLNKKCYSLVWQNEYLSHLKRKT